jgi:hypothetical protein
VVFEDEINPAMDAAFAHGLEVTELHNHFVFDRPPAYFMHIGGHGKNAEKLAQGVKARGMPSRLYAKKQQRRWRGFLASHPKSPAITISPRCRAFWAQKANRTVMS